MGDIDSSAGVGGFIEFKAGFWLTDLTIVSQDVGNDKDGILITLDAEYTIQISDKLTISPGLSTSWADDEYMQGFFGVTNTQAVQSGLRRFDSEASFKDVGVYGFMLPMRYRSVYHLTIRWDIGIF